MKDNEAIVIFGETLIDEFPDQAVVGGAPFNVARTLAYFNCDPLMISRVGKDANADLIRADMQRFKLTMQGLQIDEQHPTGRVRVTQENDTDKTSHRFDILSQQAYDYIDSEQASNSRSLASPNHDAGIFYFGTLAQRSTCSRQALHSLLETSKATTYLDLNLRTMQYSLATIEQSLHYADILKVNEEELQILAEVYLHLPQSHTEQSLSDTKIQSHAAALINMFGLQAVITTLGERGYAYLDQAGQFLRNAGETPDIAIVDTVGGGDAFSAIFLLGMQRGWPLATGLQRAHLFAAAICGVRGAVASDANFYQHWQERWAVADGKAADETALAPVAANNSGVPT